MITLHMTVHVYEENDTRNFIKHLEIDKGKKIVDKFYWYKKL